ncbi:sulfatase [Novosphingobium pentaromativorans]|uniref:Sulfatase n=1 Tax=Novosphingobium pentaromativorans US6-1 TaxID=1088721 RepID=G6EGK5_9SPHN|nr:sulfatase [Novosphingobium pentaromativorans]EHJ59552.1 sulfatase [Novosphingobium pentaromativorans US6-1]
MTPHRNAQAAARLFKTPIQRWTSKIRLFACSGAVGMMALSAADVGNAATLTAAARGWHGTAGSAVDAPTVHTTSDQPQQHKRQNVLLIISDDLAARIGPYQADVRTPNLDRLASQGVTFDRAYSQFPWCAPSRASFLTGTRPDTTGVYNLWTPFRRKLPDIATLPQYFRQNGYFSGRVGKVFHQGVPGDIGTSGPDDPQSWDMVVNPSGRDRDAENGRLNDLTPGIPYGSALTYLADDGEDEEQTDGKVASEAIRMIEQHKDDPFFIAVGFYRPHVPEVVPKKYFDLYPLDRIKLAYETPETLAQVLPASKAWTPDNFGMTETEQREIIRAYLAATSFVDAQVGRVLDAVDRMGLADDTIVVFMSDHGFLLGEHGQWMKNILFEESAQVPLIIRVPGTKNAGEHSPRTVELLDIYPTLTQMAGLPHYNRNQGTSLAELLADPDSPSWAKPALSQVNGGRSVRTERWRYTEWEQGKDGRELYDHAADPLEHRNLADDPRYAQVVSLLRAMLPPGPVEKRMGSIGYDAARDCLLKPLGPRPDKADIDKPGVQRPCDMIDP